MDKRSPSNAPSEFRHCPRASLTTANSGSPPPADCVVFGGTPRRLRRPKRWRACAKWCGTSDKVRCGVMAQEDGTPNARCSTTPEVAAIGYALQLDSDETAASSTPRATRAHYGFRRGGWPSRTGSQFNLWPIPSAPQPQTRLTMPSPARQRRRDCGTRRQQTHKVDGCTRCTNCGHIGSSRSSSANGHRSRRPILTLGALT